jgi:hypothetical protein
MSMSITKIDYEDKKEYWDYQRLLEYNRELLQKRLNRVDGKMYGPLGRVDADEFFDSIWATVSSDDLEETPKDWIPNDPKLRFEWEKAPVKNKKAKVKVRSGKSVTGNIFNDTADI